MKSIFLVFLFVCIIGCAPPPPVPDFYINQVNANLEAGIFKGLGLSVTDPELYERAFDTFSGIHNIKHKNEYIGKHVSTPKLIRYRKPEYPYSCYVDRFEGEVVAAILIGKKGNVLETRILKTSNMKFNFNTLCAIRTWEFSPGEIDGQPESFIYLVPVKFVRHRQGSER